MRHIFIALIMILGCVEVASATNFYTSSTGSDSGSCTIGSPCDLTNGLTYEFSKITPSNGDVIHMCAGACDGAGSANIDYSLGGYPDNIIPSGSSFANALTIKPYSGETIVIRPTNCVVGINIVNSDLSGVAYTIWGDPGDTGHHFILDGTNCYASFDGYDEWGNAIGIGSDGISVGYGSNHNRFINIEIKNFGTNGFIVQDTNGLSPYNEFINLRVHDNAVSDYGHGAYVASENNLLDGGEYYNHTGDFLRNYGIQVSLSGITTNDNVVRNIRIHHNAKGLYFGYGSGNVAYNNLVYDNTEEGITLGNDSGTADVAVYFNTVYGTTNNYAIQAWSGTKTIKNNIMWGNATDDIINQSTASITASNNLSTDPLFVNASGGDFHLLSTSPALGAGVAIGGITTDFDGITRPNPPAIGALEVPSGVDPGADILETFDDCTAGISIDGCNGGTGWTQSWQLIEGTATVEASGCSMPGQVLRLNSTSDTQVKRLFGARAGVFTVQWKMCSSITNPNSFGSGVTLYDQSSNYQAFVFFLSNGNIETGTLTLVAGFAANTIYTIRANVDQPNSRVRYSVNSGEFSAWESTQSSFASFTAFKAEDYSTNTHSFYVDSINDDPGPPTLPPAPVSPSGIRARIRIR